MPSFRCIVAATDFSDFSERALQRAASIALQHQADLHLLHVVRPLDLYPGMVLGTNELSLHDKAAQQAEQSRLDEQAAALAHQFGIHVHAATRLGRVHGEIAAYAQAVAADLVVTGARGENTLLDLFLGATASRLMRLLACPVLIVRKPGDVPYCEVLAAIDFSPVSAEVVRRACEIAGNARVEVLHVLGTEVEQRLRKAKLAQVDIADWLERQRAEADRQFDLLLATLGEEAAVERRIQPGLASAVICQRIEESRIDLVVLGRHGHGGGLQDWMLGSVSKDVAFATACDVLLIGPRTPQA